MKKKLFILGLTAMSFMSAKAQNHEPDSVPAVKQDTVSLTVNSEHNLKDFSYDFSDWPTNEEFIDLVSKYKNVYIDTVYVSDIRDLDNLIQDTKKPFYIAYYNQKSDDIHITYLNSSGASATKLQTRTSRHNQIVEVAELHRMAKSIKANMVAAFIHEWRHYKNRHNISLLGLSVSQIAQIQVHDEISAHIEEMLLRRKIFMGTKSLRLAQIGVESNGVRAIDKQSCFHDYFKYLKKNSENINDIPTAEEINVILKTAIYNIESDARYEKNIPLITRWKTMKLYREYMALTEIDKAQAVQSSFDDKLKSMYQFDSISILESCDDKGKSMVLKFSYDFCNAKFFQEIINELKPHIDDKASEYMTDKKANHSNSLDSDSFLLTKRQKQY